MGHTVPYTFVFKPQIYVLDLPLSYGHSYLYALCMPVINLKHKWAARIVFIQYHEKALYYESSKG